MQPTTPLSAPTSPGLRPTAIWFAAAAFAVALIAWHVVALGQAAGQRQPVSSAITTDESGLWIWSAPATGDLHLIVVVDRATRHAAVYHVDAAGSLTLRSTRNLSWDLLVDAFNVREPTPESLKNMLETPPTPR